MLKPLNCLNPQDAASNFLDAVHKQLQEKIDHAIDRYADAPDYSLLPQLENQHWVLFAPYNEMSFEYEHVNVTMLQLCNIMELVQGASTFEQSFSEELRQQVKEHVQGRLNYWHDKHTEQKMLEWRWRHDRHIEQSVEVNAG